MLSTTPLVIRLSLLCKLLKISFIKYIVEKLIFLLSFTSIEYQNINFSYNYPSTMAAANQPQTLYGSIDLYVDNRFAKSYVKNHPTFEGFAHSIVSTRKEDKKILETKLKDAVYV